MRTKFLLLLLFISITAFAAKVDTLSIQSTAMDKTYKAAVALPDSYANGKTNYPVLYLLHGAYGHFADWLKNTPDKNTVKNLVDKYNIIIVMPEGETFSFYLDSPTEKGSQFETFITKEVIAKVDATYRTIANKNGRVITGLSMGGHGALYLSARHPELFSAAGSMSGAADLGSLRSLESTEQVNKMFVPVFGTTPPSDDYLAQNAVLGMVDKMKSNKLPLTIDIGVDDFLIESNRELHRRLVYAKVPHDYTERPGAHTWEYWENSLPYQVLFFAKVLKANGSLN
ncbi:MAG: alpha/beta hydrolase-fold protein [Flavobacterium sp.]|nr:alpha/beta hydrolase-fold protein [Flavobacterium sp.]